MLMPKNHRTLIYEYLMKEGVVVAEKDFGLDKHPVIAVPNIHVIKALQVRWSSIVNEYLAVDQVFPIRPFLVTQIT
jgi:hypothetical protein